MNVIDRFSLGAVSIYRIFFDTIIRRKKFLSTNKSIPGGNSIRKKTVRIPASSTHYIPKNMNKKMKNIKLHMVADIKVIKNIGTNN